jgi:hypothetical protein
MAQWNGLRLCHDRRRVGPGDQSAGGRADFDTVLDSGLLDHVWDGALAAQGFTDTDLASIARELSVSCPQCGAAVAEWCRYNPAVRTRLDATYQTTSSLADLATEAAEAGGAAVGPANSRIHRRDGLAVVSRDPLAR